MQVQSLSTLKAKTIKYFLLISTTLLLAQTAFADCELPVCDIPGTLTALEKDTLDVRATFLGDLYKKYKSTTSIASLGNLRDFAKQSYNLQKKLQDPDNVLAWSVFLRESSISGLLRLSPFQLDLLKGLYAETFEIPELSIERQMGIRYDVFKRWSAEIPSIMDVKVVYDVYAFITYAFNTSETSKDEDYILREAVNNLDKLGKRLSYLYPSYEGVFEIKTYCAPDAKQCGVVDLAANRLTFVNSMTDLGIFSSLSSSERGVQNFIFFRGIIEEFGTKLYSVSELLSTSGRPSELYLQLAKNQDVKGYVVTPRYSGTLQFEGKVIYSPLNFYVDEGIEKQKPVITGKFEGTFGDKKASIIIRQKRNKSLFATMVVGGEEELIFDFTNGEYVEHRGIINLAGFPHQKVEPFKINLAYRKNAAGKYRWTGGYFSIAGKFEFIEFTRTGNIQE